MGACSSLSYHVLSNFKVLSRIQHYVKLFNVEGSYFIIDCIPLFKRLTCRLIYEFGTYLKNVYV